jgi:hypothetical protein
MNIIRKNRNIAIYNTIVSITTKLYIYLYYKVYIPMVLYR